MGTLFLAAAAAVLFASAALAFFRPAARASRILFLAGALLQLAAFCLLVRSFIVNDFSVVYVRDNSSLATPLIYKISATWAGQQGSFLLWALLTSVSVIPLLGAKGRWIFPIAAAAAAAFALVSFSAANPFVHAAPAADGSGLRTILRNPWMAIHPPVLFFGYALTVIPFARALDAVIRKDLAALVSSRASVFLIAAVTGAGIALGGIWAYETLGWGGFWGWDPVENSSLVPWLVSVALVHVLLLQSKRGHWEKMSFALSASLFILALLSSFLTRSGILASVSVHSFTSSSLALPLGFMTSCAIIAPSIVFAKERRNFPPSKKQEAFREIVFGTGVTIFIFYAFMILGATIAPLAFVAAGRAPASVKVSFFNNVSVVFATLFLCASLICIPWQIRRPKWKTAAAAALCSALLFAFAFLRFTPFSPWLHLSAAAAGATVALCVIRLFSGNVRPMFPTLLGHAGLALFIAGCIAVGVLSTSERKEIPAGDTIEVAGTKITFGGIKDEGRKGSFLLTIEERGSKHETGIPFEKLPDGSIMSVRPAISHGLLRDTYLYIEGFLSKADIEKIVKTEKLEAKPVDTVLVNVSKKEMILFVLAGTVLLVAGLFAGFIRSWRAK